MTLEGISWDYKCVELFFRKFKIMSQYCNTMTRDGAVSMQIEHKITTDPTGMEPDQSERVKVSRI